MTERIADFFGINLSGIRELLRSTRTAATTRVVAYDDDSSMTVPHGGELFVLAVPVDTRDLLYARLLELQDLNRNTRPERKRVRFAGWELDLLERRLVAPGGAVARLPGLEYGLLRTFIHHPRQLLSRAELAMSTRREGQTYSSVRTIDTYVSRLRRRLSHGGGDSLISTVPKVGYSFDVDVMRN
jgi:two-component system, OmpR family, response regulator